jgi:hypothetical protein
MADHRRSVTEYFNLSEVQSTPHRSPEVDDNEMSGLSDLNCEVPAGESPSEFNRVLRGWLDRYPDRGEALEAAAEHFCSMALELQKDLRLLREELDRIKGSGGIAVRQLDQERIHNRQLLKRNEAIETELIQMRRDFKSKFQNFKLIENNLNKENKNLKNELNLLTKKVEILENSNFHNPTRSVYRPPRSLSRTKD